ncbi:MAG TPA: bifunctional YncE family protein/alkaline phosphatase family protein [Trebonia sp.]
MQVARNRRAEKPPLLGRIGRLGGRKVRLATAGAGVIALAFTGTGIAYAQTHEFGTDEVGTTASQGLVVSDDQFLSPYGNRLVLNNGKIMSSVVSPDGTHMAVTLADGSQAVGIVNLTTKTVQQYINGAYGNNVGQEGPTYSPDGTQLWVAQSTGFTKFTVNADGSLSNPVKVPLPNVNGLNPLPGAAVFSKDGSTVYAAVNGQNTVVAINASTGAVVQTWNVGTAPRGMVMVGSKLYVSDEGGRPAQAGDTTINSYGTQVPADSTGTHATTGAVSVIDTANPTATPAMIAVGNHPSAVYAKGGAVFVTNTFSNTVSVIDTASDKVVQTIDTQPWDESSTGYEPNAVTLTDDGHLLVTLEGANAVAVYNYTDAKTPVSYVGLIPTDYAPAEITTVGNQVVVSNMRGIDARRSSGPAHGTHDTTASLTYFTLPSDGTIASMTGTVFTDNGWHGGSVALGGNSNTQPVPVPVKIGDPSTIKYVFLIVKENRTYDQQFGDMPQGNGDPAFTQFGEKVTPNNHALATQFGLYDNFYDAGTNSAEGHNWIAQADNPEYTQSLAGQYIRSYDTENDVLGHQITGTIWTGAQAAGKSIRDFGWFQSFDSKPAGSSWQNLYCDARNMEASPSANTAYPLNSTSPIPSLNNNSVHGFPLFDTSVPDIYKEQIWQRDFEKNGPANLNMFWLSNDHTGGPPSAAAQVADNDLALGQIVDEISHSKYWPQSAIFVEEDDSQAGSDHVDGHRAPVQIISPYAQHGVVDNTYYSQITMDRTIEQILGIHPMNQKDAAATPMFGAFTQHANYTPFNAVPNQTSLTAGLSGTTGSKALPSCGANVPAGTTPAAIAASTAVPANMTTVAAQWATWITKQHTTGPNAVPDYANPEQMNRYVWYQTSDWKKPYPGDSKIYAPSEVPGATLPGFDS